VDIAVVGDSCSGFIGENGAVVDDKVFTSIVDGAFFFVGDNTVIVDDF